MSEKCIQSKNIFEINIFCTLSEGYIAQIKSSENLKKKVYDSSHHGFAKGKSCLSNSITLNGLNL